MKALIFGVNGQDGHYLCALCKQKKIEPIGVSRSGNWVHADVSKFELVENLIKLHQPDYVFHMAAKSSTRHDVIFENHETIATGSINILESVMRHSKKSKVFITGSGVQFKNTGNPISEYDEFEANSPYSIARIHSVYAARYYRTLGIETYVGYLFHHESPYRKPNHVSQLVAQAVNRIERGSNEKIELGNIDVEKEWVFAGDIANAIFTLVEQDQIFEATIGSGVGYTIKDWLETCFGRIDKNWMSHVRLKDSYTPEYPKLISNPATINSLGWSPSVSFSELAEMMINKKRSRLL